MIRTALSVCLSCQNNEKLPLWSQEVLIWYQILYGHGFLSWFEATKLCVPRQSLTFFGLSVFNSVQFSDSVVSDFLRPHESQDTRPSCPLPTPGVYPNSYPSSQWCYPAISSVMLSSHLILCHFLLLLPPIPPNIRVFSNESALHMRWPKYWSFSVSIRPSNEYSGLTGLL